MANLNLTPETQALLLKGISKGLTYKAAAQHAGIDDKVFARWRRKGRKATSGYYHHFHKSLTEARILGRAALLEMKNLSGARGYSKVTREKTESNGQVEIRVYECKTRPSRKAAAWLLEWKDKMGDRLPNDDEKALLGRIEAAAASSP